MTGSARKLIDSFGPLSFERRKELEDYADYLEVNNKKRYEKILCEYDSIIKRYNG